MAQRRRGSAIPVKRYRGTVPVKRVYRGSTLVWRERYETSVTGSAATGSQSVWLTVLTHTISSPQGRGIITASGYWGHIYSNTTHDLAILVNGVTVASASTPSDRAAKFHIVTASDRLLAAGDVVTIQVRSNSTDSTARTFTPTLSIV